MRSWEHRTCMGKWNLPSQGPPVLTMGTKLEVATCSLRYLGPMSVDIGYIARAGSVAPMWTTWGSLPYRP